MTRAHLFVSGTDGALYDTRAPFWSHQPPLRPVYRKGFPRIHTTAQLKAALRYGPFAWPGGYQMYLVCSDGAALCFDCAHKNLRLILPAVHAHDKSGWDIVATDINYEDADLTCDHCNEAIPAAYNDAERHGP